MTGRAVWRSFLVGGIIAMSLVLAVSAGVTVRVFDNGSDSDDDLARVWVDGQSLGTIDFNPGGTNQRTWDLGIPASGTHTLVVEFTEDEDADHLCDEHSGTFGIEFGGDGLAASDDSEVAARGMSIDIPVLDNDVYVQAGSTATDAIPCPSELPAPTQTCSCVDSRTTYSTTFDVSGGSISLDRIVSPPSKGTAQIIGDEIRYTPDPDGCGIDTFTYEADGPSGSSDTATVIVSISSSPPTAADDESETSEDESVLIDVLSNDVDSGGGALTIDSVGSPSHGSTIIAGDEVRYTPDDRYEGADRFSYVVRDPCGATATAWVDVAVLRENNPPAAMLGGPYQGLVGESVELSARFSSDPDLGDRLEFRWDLDDDGRFETGWLRDSTYEAVYDATYVGRVTVEVRDLYLGQPNGTSAWASAIIRIDAIQTLQVHVFEDLDGDEAWTEGEPDLAGVDVSVAGETLRTAQDGRISIELDAGTWMVELTDLALAGIEDRGFAIAEAEASVTLLRGGNALVEFAAAKTSTRFKGVVYADSNGNGEFDEEDRAVGGVAVVLDGEVENPVVTDEAGRFAFREVPFGPHEIYVVQTGVPEDETPPSLLIPFTLSRAEKPEIYVVWPYALGPEEGFLQVDVQKGEGGTP